MPQPNGLPNQRELNALSIKVGDVCRKVLQLGNSPPLSEEESWVVSAAKSTLGKFTELHGSSNQPLEKQEEALEQFQFEMQELSRHIKAQKRFSSLSEDAKKLHEETSAYCREVSGASAVESPYKDSDVYDDKPSLHQAVSSPQRNEQIQEHLSEGGKVYAISTVNPHTGATQSLHILDNELHHPLSTMHPELKAHIEGRKPAMIVITELNAGDASRANVHQVSYTHLDRPFKDVLREIENGTLQRPGMRENWNGMSTAQKGGVIVNGTFFALMVANVIRAGMMLYNTPATKDDTPEPMKQAISEQRNSATTTLLLNGVLAGALGVILKSQLSGHGR